MKSNHLQGWALLLMRWTGLRISEVYLLPYDCVLTQGEYSYLKVPLGKLLSERLVPLTSARLELIHNMKAKTTEYYRKKEIPISSLHLLYSRENTKLSSQQVRRFFHLQVQDLPGGRSFTPHQLRHTFATSLLNAGMGLSSIMKLMGHRSPNMTLRYTKLAPETLRTKFFTALEKMKLLYPMVRSFDVPYELGLFNPEKAFSDLSKWITKNNSRSPKVDHRSRLLLKRLDRLKEDVLSFESSVQSEKM